MTAIIIREPTIDDVDRLFDLIKQLGYKISEDELVTRIKLFSESLDHFAYLALLDNEIVGIVAFSTFEMFHKIGRCARIVSLVIDENCRGKGIGRKLVHYVELQAKSMACDMLELTSNKRRISDGTHAFYLSMGFNKYETQSVYFKKHI